MTTAIQTRNDGVAMVAKLNRPNRRNPIDDAMLRELHAALDAAEANAECRVLVLEGSEGSFCSGLDFSAVEAAETGGAPGSSSTLYMQLLSRFASSCRIVIAKIEGQVLAGGVGLVAASDFAVCTPASTFALSEALWGLLPACVLPYLIRRVGFQKAYTMTLTTRTVPAPEAASIGLVDEMSEQPADTIRRWLLRLAKLHPDTTRDLKAYFRTLGPITDAVEQDAVSEIERLLCEPRVRGNIERYVRRGEFPWER